MKKNNLLLMVPALFIGQIQLIADVALYIPTFTNMDYYSQEYKKCYSNTHWTTSSMSICMSEEADRQNVLLNKEYKSVMSQLPKERKASLSAAQSAWMKYRSANCNWYNDPNGGTSATLSASQCFLNMTTSRLIEMTTEGFHG